MSKYSSDIEAFMSQDDLKGLIRFLKVLQETDNGTKNKLSSFAGRLSKLESDRSLGLLSQDEYSKERNQIRYGIIQLSNNIEVKAQQAEEKKEKRNRLLAIIQKYGIIVLASSLLILLSAKAYNYISYINNMSIPYKYVGKEINKNYLEELYKDLEKDSTLGNKKFNNTIEYLYSVSRGRDEYIKHNNFDSAYFDFNSILDSINFENEFEDFVEELSQKDISLSTIYEEIEHEKYLRDELLYDEIQNEYSRIDQICKEVQKDIDKKYQIADNLSKNIDVSLFNVDINKRDKRLEARTTIRNGTGHTLYSVTSRLYIVDKNTMDTLASIAVSIDEPKGINAVYRQSLDFYSSWDHPLLFNAIKNYKVSDLFFFDKILKVNAGGENFNLLFGYKPSKLVHDAYFYLNEHYQTPEKLEGNCPYLGYKNKDYQTVHTNVRNLIKEKLKEDGYSFKESFSKLNFNKE